MSNWTGSRFTNIHLGGRQCLTGQALASQTGTLGGVGGNVQLDRLLLHKHAHLGGGRQCLTGQALASQTHTLGGEAMSNWTGSCFTNRHT